MKFVLIALLVAVLGILLIELSLRLFWGFGNPPLYVADDQIGYLLAPNQRLRRMGNRIEINQYSMRSPATTIERPATTLRVLLLGDSLVNGNWWTDQSQTLSALIAQPLRTEARPEGYQSVEVLNASANSWGPRNQLAYLERFGTFEATVVVLVLNTDDLFGTQPSPLQVGRDRSYPSRKPPAAIAEFLNRYQKQPPIPGLAEIQNEGGDRVGMNLAAIQAIQQQARAAQSEFILVLSPLKREVLPPGPRDYEQVARQRLAELAIAAQIRYLDLLATYQQQSEPESLYRDHIHLSPAGNALVSCLVVEQIQAALDSSAKPLP
ncbi:SGNH/GDSL hydrolase family protein [Romeria aff. gracilis LEGE 07310]|uniref:SGNH/GDSL hydrolase family protein n=1 Tax=Vasconcelosia minhoensis LEGE 07310 TaxID=915328 RepID=A0A8J7DPD4_9CYAN|nr:SGNH/GDSL hydrolase family protein [Romeria gracilis]MBE9079505.1 SGNH/GDSL hydrolase family protein [Romeria aff. gracilis LEGE 07310]